MVERLEKELKKLEEYKQYLEEERAPPSLETTVLAAVTHGSIIGGSFAMGNPFLGAGIVLGNLFTYASIKVYQVDKAQELVNEQQEIVDELNRH